MARRGKVFSIMSWSRPLVRIISFPVGHVERLRYHYRTSTSIDKTAILQRVEGIAKGARRTPSKTYCFSQR